MVIHDGAERGKLKVYDVRDRDVVKMFQRHPEIQMGEAETLAAAKENGHRQAAVHKYGGRA